jgi:hypothetical protein
VRAPDAISSDLAYADDEVFAGDTFVESPVHRCADDTTYFTDVVLHVLDRVCVHAVIE